MSKKYVGKNAAIIRDEELRWKDTPETEAIRGAKYLDMDKKMDKAAKKFKSPYPADGNFKKGGAVKSRGDGCITHSRTKGRMR